jgi:hypothetical protein
MNKFQLFNIFINTGGIPPVFITFLVLIFFHPVDVLGQNKYSSIGYGVDEQVQIVIKKSVSNFFESHETNLDETTINSIINSDFNKYFKITTLINSSVNGKNYISVKTSLINEDILVKNKNSEDFSSVNNLLNKNSFNKKIINEMFNQMFQNLSFYDIFEADFKLVSKQLKIDEEVMEMEIQSNFYFKSSFNLFLESINLVLNEIKLDDKDIIIAKENSIPLYPSIILTNNNSFAGIISSNDLQINLLELLDRINYLLYNHYLINDMTGLTRPFSYSSREIDFALSFENNNWNGFNFQSMKEVKKVVGSNFITGSNLDSKSLINSFSSEVLKNSKCLSNDLNIFNNLLILDNDGISLLFPLNIFTTVCLSDSTPIISYFYKSRIKTSNLSNFNLDYKVYN